MQPRTCMLSAFTLSTAMALGAPAIAADLPKEGTYSGTFSGWGTFKGTQIGLLTVFDQNALVLTSGLLDHTTWHCYGLGDFTNGMGLDHGYCAATDPAGDQPPAIWPLRSMLWTRRV
jgi:hypothetical protein